MKEKWGEACGKQDKENAWVEKEGGEEECIIKEKEAMIYYNKLGVGQPTLQA